MTTQTLRPLGNRVLIKHVEENKKLKGGIILPDSANKKQATAEVIAIGPGSKTEHGQILPMPVAVGDKVLIDKYSGQEVTLNDEPFVIVKAEDIIAIIN